MAKNHKLWALSGSFRVGHWGVKLTKITKLHTRHSFFRTSTSTFDVSQRVIFPCQLIRSRILSETEGKLFSKFVLHGPHIFSFTKPEVFSSGPRSTPTSERDLMLKVFSEPISDSSSKTWKCPVRCFKQKCESFFRERLLFLDKLHFFWGRWCKQGIIEAEVSRLVILRHGIG